jgi:hypothetical protein
MRIRTSSSFLAAAAALLLIGACSNQPSKPGGSSGTGTGVGGSGSGAAGSAPTGSGAAGSTSAGAAGGGDMSGVAGAGSGAAGNTITGVGGTTGSAGQQGAAGSTGAAGVATGLAGMGAAGAMMTGDGGTSDTDPPPPRPNMAMGTKKVTVGNLRVDLSKPVIPKLILLLGGICGGTGAGGIESFIEQYGFYIYSPATQTCVNSAPQMYKDAIAKNPMDPEANRQTGDSRMELWDGVDRVPWVTVAKGASIQEETIAALKQGMVMAPDADFGYFLNADGTLRTTDVWVVGYSWGSQTWGMISSYVRFGRVICTSGPQAEGFPNADWILKPGPNRTPPDRQFTLLGFNADYPSMDKLDTAPNTVTSMIDTTTKAGWQGPPINVHPGDMGPFAPGHQIAMVGANPNSPGGHTVFCTNNPMNGWKALCQYVFNVK